MKNKILMITGLSLFTLALVFIMTRPSDKIIFKSTTTPDETATVSRIIDGDTIIIRWGTHTESVRLLGVEAAELDYGRPLVPSHQACFAIEARNELSRLILGQTIRLKADPLNKDRDTYNRLLRYVYLTDGTLVNERLIRTGFTEHLSRYPLTLAETLAEAEITARTEKAGRWAGNCQ
jgi:micrococcal nuclease